MSDSNGGHGWVVFFCVCLSMVYSWVYVGRTTIYKLLKVPEGVYCWLLLVFSTFCIGYSLKRLGYTRKKRRSVIRSGVMKNDRRIVNNSNKSKSLVNP